MSDDEHLAYGDVPGEPRNDDRGIVGDTLRKVKQSEGFASIFNKVQRKVQELGAELGVHIDGAKLEHSHGQDSSATSVHRFGSFADQRDGNDVKWYVDGCAYMWAVSVAIEQAKESIWILDWWLSPELYLRRPPSKNEQYRLDRMLQAAAQRGVKVNIIVYKEVAQALTRTDPVTSALGMFGIAATFISLEQLEDESPLIAPPVPVSSVHTKHALEALSPNISVFRHPDHLPDAQAFESSLLSSLEKISITAETVARLPGNTLKALYGMKDDVILFWAHHEKLCLVDGQTAFMGGLDLCYGRWDTNQHPIADCHPGNLDDIVFPGQDFNNARLMDFVNVSNWENNKLDRKESSRMGWSDVSVSLHGPVVEDLKSHFADRWNFIYKEKYDARKNARYSVLGLGGGLPGPSSSSWTQTQTSQQQQPQEHGAQHNSGYEQQPASLRTSAGSQTQSHSEVPYSPPLPVYDRGTDQTLDRRREEEAFDAKGMIQTQPHIGHSHMDKLEQKRKTLEGGLERALRNLESQHATNSKVSQGERRRGLMGCQIVRSSAQWSHGTETENSIVEAYIRVIQNSQHFVYIENQFFITATSDKQRPIKNMIGAAIVERILRAARAGEKYKIIVVLPAIPAFAGDLKDESSLGTRAIMQYQYNSINRGGHSIMESISNAGYDPTNYIRFYNLRNYDRINANSSLQRAELESGIDYEEARKEHDDIVDRIGHLAQEGLTAESGSVTHEKYEKYQQAAGRLPDQSGLGSSRWDSVAECYMLGGPDVRDIPWEDGDVSEIDAFISEELYVHSKVLVADDRVVICGSANLNDRSQLGYRDSEIALIIEDSEQVDSYMNERPWRASKFAATLRRQLFRKHLGLLRPQDMTRSSQDFDPVGTPNSYDFGSAEDRAVADPLSESFLGFWNTRARQNTNAFGRIFRPVPHDDVRTWADYNSFYERFLPTAVAEAEGKKGQNVPSVYKYGHVVKENFPPGAQGVKEVKDLLSTIKGTLVEMPLLFLIKEDIAKEGLSLNAFTEELYT